MLAGVSIIGRFDKHHVAVIYFLITPRANTCEYNMMLDGLFNKK